MSTTWDSKEVVHDTAHLERARNSPDLKDNSSDSDDVSSRWSLNEQKRILRKVDVRLIPICGLMYCVSLLDRTNLSNAAIAGYGSYFLGERLS